MKLSDIPSPRYAHEKCIKVPGEKEYNILMKRLEALGWKWGTIGYGMLPTSKEYNIDMQFIYLTHNGYIMYDDYYDEPHIYDLYEIEDWETELSLVVTHPRNNDNRTTCYWCGAPCKQVQGIVNTYNICTGCGK